MWHCSGIEAGSYNKTNTDPMFTAQFLQHVARASHEHDSICCLVIAEHNSLVTGRLVDDSFTKHERAGERVELHEGKRRHGQHPVGRWCSTYCTLVIRYVYSTLFEYYYEVFCAVRHVHDGASTHQAKQYATSSNDVARG